MSYTKIFNERARVEFPDDAVVRADEAIKLFDATPQAERDELWKQAENVPRKKNQWQRRPRRQPKKGDDVKIKVCTHPHPPCSPLLPCLTTGVGAVGDEAHARGDRVLHA
jgi:hypothetical protein